MISGLLKVSSLIFFWLVSQCAMINFAQAHGDSDYKHHAEHHLMMAMFAEKAFGLAETQGLGLNETLCALSGDDIRILFQMTLAQSDFNKADSRKWASAISHAGEYEYRLKCFRAGQ